MQQGRSKKLETPIAILEARDFSNERFTIQLAARFAIMRYKKQKERIDRWVKSYYQ